MGIPVIAKPQAPEGKVQVKERCLLSQKPCSWSARREMFQKRPCVSAGATEDSGLLSADTAQQIRVK